MRENPEPISRGLSSIAVPLRAALDLFSTATGSTRASLFCSLPTREKVYSHASLPMPRSYSPAISWTIRSLLVCVLAMKMSADAMSGSAVPSHAVALWRLPTANVSICLGSSIFFRSTTPKKSWPMRSRPLSTLPQPSTSLLWHPTSMLLALFALSQKTFWMCINPTHSFNQRLPLVFRLQSARPAARGARAKLRSIGLESALHTPADWLDTLARFQPATAACPDMCDGGSA